MSDSGKVEESEVGSRNRVMIPAVCRKGLGWIIKGHQTRVSVECIEDGRLAIRPSSRVNAVRSDVKSDVLDDFAEGDPVRRRFISLVFEAKLQEAVIDDLGRLCLTKAQTRSLLALASNNEDMAVVVIAFRGELEIWHSSYYQKALSKEPRLMASLYERLSSAPDSSNDDLSQSDQSSIA